MGCLRLREPDARWTTDATVYTAQLGIMTNPPALDEDPMRSAGASMLITIYDALVCNATHRPANRLSRGDASCCSRRAGLLPSPPPSHWTPNVPADEHHP
jgi:hypothetical protein